MSDIPWKDLPLTAEGRITFIERYIVLPTTGEPFKLAEFQKAYIRELYADDTQVCYLSISRGNAKTSLQSAIGLTEVFMNPHVPMVNLYSITTDQATQDDGVYGAAVLMVKFSPDLRDRCKISLNNIKPGIFTAWNNGTMKVVAAKMDDRLVGGAPTLAILDEAASSFWTEKRVAAIRQGLGKRKGARMACISMPNSQASAFYGTRKRFMAGKSSPGVKWIEYSALDTDDLEDRSVWRRVNPAIDAGFLDIDTLEGEFVDLERWQFKLTRLGMHEVADVGQGWLGVEGAKAYDEASTDVEHETDLPLFLGLDLSFRSDLAAVAAVQLKDGKWYATAKIFEPSPTIDHIAVMEHIKAMCALYDVKSIGFDPAQATVVAQMLLEDGYPMLEVSQQPQQMTPMFANLHKLIMDGNFVAQTDDQFRAHMLTGYAKMQPSGGFTVAKRSRTDVNQKQDALYAVCDAMIVAGAADQDVDLVYYL